MDLDALTVKTTNGAKFTGLQHARLAHMIWKRFGEDYRVAAAAWRRLLENNVEDWRFEELVGAWHDHVLDKLKKDMQD